MSQALSGNEASALATCRLPGSRRLMQAYPAIQAIGTQFFFIGSESRDDGPDGRILDPPRSDPDLKSHRSRGQSQPRCGASG